MLAKVIVGGDRCTCFCSVAVLWAVVLQSVGDAIIIAEYLRVPRRHILPNQ